MNNTSLLFQYEQMRGQAASMKERYEERLAELEEEKQQIITDAQEAINRMRESGGGGKDAVVGEVSVTTFL